MTSSVGLVLNVLRFSIERYSSSYCNVKTNTGEYSCLTVDLVFKRQFSYYLITIYVPGCMLVIVSWVCPLTFYQTISDTIKL